MVRIAAAFAFVATLLAHPTRSEELLLDFSTPYCGPCRQMEPTVQAFERAGYPIRKVDATREPQLASQFNVTRFPTFLMLVDNQEVDRVVGFTSGDRIQQMFAKAREVSLGRTRGQSPDPTPRPPHREPPTSAGPSTSAASIAPPNEPAWPACEGWAGTERQPNRNPQPDAQAVTDNSSANQLNATVRLKVDDGKYRSFGTGTIIDARSGEALIITCGHLFRETKGKTPVQVELFEAASGGARVAGETTGQVISYDLDRDIALVSIRPGREVQVAKVAAADAVIKRGDRVVTIGCSNGDDPTVLSSRITDLNRYLGPPNIEASGAPAEGRSGGGMFNSEGQLIGVCTNADYEGNEGLYAALESVHGELDRLNLSEIYTRSGSGDRPGTSAPAPLRNELGNDRIVRGQDDLPVGTLAPPNDITPLPQTTPASTNARSALPPNLSTTEQAAFEEIVSRAATHEVVCIVRPNEPGGESEIITLNGVSAEFVRALADRQTGSPSATKTR